MELFLLSTVTVAVAEIGDRSMLLAALFGMRFQQRWAVFGGMATGLFVNQLLTAIAGVWLFSLFAGDWHLWLVGAAFLAIAVWTLIPEDDADASTLDSARGAFVAAAVAFFLFEMLDKTQVAVISLAGATASLIPVVLGATVGILLITTPALLLGQRLVGRVPLATLRLVAAGLFAVFGVATLLTAAGLGADLLTSAVRING